MSQKTPISLLQEVCVRRGITPVYELLSNQGPIHEPLFVIQCTAGEWSASFQGGSKKKAKQHAAYLVLMKMISSSAITSIEHQSLCEVQANLIDAGDLPKSGSNANEGVLVIEDTNPIGDLQEYCQKNMWPQPTYEFSSNTPNHNRDYHCTVKLWKWTEMSVGKSKKQAKRRAAQDLLHRIIRENLSIPQEALELMEEQNLPLAPQSGLQIMQDSRAPDYVQIIQRNVNRAMKGVWTHRGKRLLNLDIDMNDPELNAIPCLESLADKHNFSYHYTYITNTKSGKIHSLLQLSTYPAIIVKGTGDSLDSCRQKATLQALVYLKTMTREKAYYPAEGQCAMDSLDETKIQEL